METRIREEIRDEKRAMAAALAQQKAEMQDGAHTDDMRKKNPYEEVGDNDDAAVENGDGDAEEGALGETTAADSDADSEADSDGGADGDGDAEEEARDKQEGADADDAGGDVE